MTTPGAKCPNGFLDTFFYSHLNYMNNETLLAYFIKRYGRP
jgi:hypothetical protein